MGGSSARWLFLLAGTLGCATPWLDDGSSASLGSAARGVLRRGVELPPQGDGYVRPPTWQKRGLSYGTEELVHALVRSARAVDRDLPGGQLGIADLSGLGGGPVRHHRSHRTGRDVDLIFYATDESGQPLPQADAMVHYGPDGMSRGFGVELPIDPAWKPTSRRFDDARNWRLIKALLEDPEVDVQWIFIAEALRDRLIEHAFSSGEPFELIDRALAILHRPNDSEPHDDHMHVRLYCDAADRMLGCVDEGPARWWKKHLKYREPAYARKDRPLPRELENLTIGPGWLLGAALTVR